MSNYSKSTNFATKDNLTPGDPLKIVRGTEIDTEFNNIATAIATKTDNASAAIVGGTINDTTIGATTASTGAFTTLAASGNVTLSGGTANGVAYLNGSKVVTSGSALWFDGTNFGVGTGGNTLNQQSVVYKAGANAIYQQVANGSTGLGATNGIRVGLTSAGVGEWYSPTAAISYIDNTEQMRLTSTGLGIGTSSPSYKLDVNGQARLGGSTGLVFGVGTAFAGGQAEIYSTSTTPMGLGTTGAAVLRLYTNSTLQATLDSSGNLGLGVTPSAWNTYKALEIGRVGNYFAGYSGGTELTLGANAYYSTGWKYAVTGALATRYMTDNSGGHYWYTAPSGTAGNAITFTQAATLTENGNYLVGTTTENSGSGGLKVAGQFAVTSSQAFTSSGTVNSTAFYVVCYSLSGTCTLTLPTPSTNVGRVLKIVTQSNQAIVSASSNVTAIASGGLTTSILPATAGKWAELWCDGSYWAIIGTNA